MRILKTECWLEITLSIAQRGVPKATHTDYEILVGSEDWQSNPSNVTAFADLLGITVNIVQNDGHSLDKDYVSHQLDRWLN